MFERCYVNKVAIQTFVGLLNYSVQAVMRVKVFVIGYM